MANLHLVTGHAGEPHVKSTDDASLMQAIYGGDSVVLDRINAFSYDVISNNIIRVYDGEALMQGRYIKMDKGNYVDLNIDNGHTGYRRIDVIAIEYTKNDETSIEEANLVVVKGSETQQEEATVPELIDGDTVDGSASTNQMALYHVKIDGLSITDVEQAFTLGQDFQTIVNEQIPALETTKADKSALAEERSERLAEIAVERERINNIVALPSGSTTGDAELQDIRIGVDGKTYATAGDAVRGQVSELKSDLTELSNDVGIIQVQYTSVSGKYIDTDGSERASKPFSHTNPFAVRKGDLVVVKATGYLTNVTMISTCNADLSNISVKVVCTDSTNRVYKYLCDADCYVVVSYLTESGAIITLKSEKTNERLNSRLTESEESNERLNSRLTESEDRLNVLDYDSRISVLADEVIAERGQLNKYISYSGNVYDSNNFYITSPIAMKKGQTIRFNCKGYLKAVAMLSSIEDGVYTPLIVSDDNDEHIFIYTCMIDMNVVISCHANVTAKYSVYASQIGLNNARITALEHDFVAFTTIGVIGDSLASGASNYSGGVSDIPIYSWGKSIERKHGIDVTLFSYGGATTRSWLSNDRGATALSNANVLECYIIGLGVNDAYSLGVDYLGSISDVHVGSESENADTYYGNYSKIISVIKAKSPRAKIFCLTNPKGTDEVSSAYNQAVKDIVLLYSNIYLIDLIADSFYTSDIFKNTWYSAHSTALGYNLIGENIYAHINDTIQKRISEFTDIQWIVENHP